VNFVFTAVVLKYVLIWFAINSKIVVFLKEYFNWQSRDSYSTF